MPTTQLFEATKIAFPAFTDTQLAVLKALLFAPNLSSTAGKLRILLGLAAVFQVNGAIGQAGRKVYEALGRHPDGLEQGTFQWWHVIATAESRSNTDGFVWKLREEVAEALEYFGLTRTGQKTADEVNEQNRFLEGTVRVVRVNAYERNPVARSRCLQYYGYRCTACLSDLSEIYGQVAEQFIHVHHLRELSTIGEEYEVDPIADLRPVCPNCHAVIHMATPPYTIEKVREFIAAQRRDA